MNRTEPLNVIWWLVSRASGIVALVLISATVLLGLAMATRMLRRPATKRVSARLHEHLALVAIAAIALHGAALLGDHWLKPGWRGITIPFALSYRPEFTGIGIIAGYLAALLGPSFYLRRQDRDATVAKPPPTDRGGVGAFGRARARRRDRRPKVVVPSRGACAGGARRLPTSAEVRLRAGPQRWPAGARMNGQPSPESASRRISPLRGAIATMISNSCT